LTAPFLCPSPLGGLVAIVVCSLKIDIKSA
jgi:hypothetical protein